MTTTVKKDVHWIEAAAEAAGIDLAAAKASLATLDKHFEGSYGDIPEGALGRWVDEFMDFTKARQLFMALGRVWEK